ncbi:GDP-fucose protein O-fucosyltransferase protein [Dioscorea alata]|uniref:GDP-fucose protein O-fucosyltransferase protein n=1 Tax=Dioscorea alata TaxID=55571 RepID=A0ACB7V6G1_DIOAL|nr:GDP-fucose protein O-fucosyltransferase protein [Dioscorea alata]
MAPLRRRTHVRCPIPAISATPAFSAAALVLLLFLASFSLLGPPLLDRASLPGSFHSLKHREDLKEDADVVVELFHVPDVGSSKPDLWASKRGKHFYGCSNASRKFSSAEVITRPERYLMIATSGGLNQQRTGITDAVVAARILNATLVVPRLDQKSFWKDASNFTQIFDVDWFISFLSKDVKIIKQLPRKRGKVIRSPYTMRVPRKCTPRCYENRVLPVLLKKHVVELTKFDFRLANKLETDLQKLRCRVNYHALRFTKPILKMGETLIRRMKEKGKHFIALHLRFEPDMLAFSGCDYGGGDKEKRELGAIRKRWKTLHISNPEKERRHGKCPLTPEEVGLMLRALGYGKDVHIYVASGEVYGGEDTLAPLKALFPNFHSKEILASKEELAPFATFSSRMAALDFIVCDRSDAFVTNNNGNMARILAGRRRYFGHKRTIRPNARKLYSLFLKRANLTWDEFASKVRTFQKGFMGEPKEIRPGRGEFHENPSTCICEDTQPKVSKDKGEGSSVSSVDELPDSPFSDEEPSLPDQDYGENEPLGLYASNGTEWSQNLSIPAELFELEDMFSD